jgi:hypothetical protein
MGKALTGILRNEKVCTAISKRKPSCHVEFEDIVLSVKLLNW